MQAPWSEHVIHEWAHAFTQCPGLHTADERVLNGVQNQSSRTQDGTGQRLASILCSGRWLGNTIDSSWNYPFDMSPCRSVCTDSQGQWRLWKAVWTDVLNVGLQFL